MRCMDKSRHGVFVSRFEGKRPETDSQGRLTGRHEMSYTEPVEVLASVSSARGQAQDSMFGLNLDYDRIVAIDDPSFAIDESSRVWIEHAADEPFDYAVKCVSRSESYTVVAVKRVEVSR